jgi:hypothetical protein
MRQHPAPERRTAGSAFLFATPRGGRKRVAVVDFLWRAVNVVAGLAILSRHPVILGINLGSPFWQGRRLASRVARFRLAPPPGGPDALPKFNLGVCGPRNGKEARFAARICSTMAAAAI